MSGDSTPNLDLQYLDPSQAQPEVKINDAWDKIDAAAGGVKVATANSPLDQVSTRVLKFANATVVQETDGSVVITVSGGGADSDSGGGSLTVIEEASPHVTVHGVTTLQFSGATVAAESSGVARVTVAGGSVPLTTKGDLLGYDTAVDRIPVGTDSYVLTADSTQALGLKWAPAALAIPYPGTLNDLVYWFQADAPLISSGNSYGSLANSTPWNIGQAATGTGLTRSATPLNSLGVGALSGAPAYVMNSGLVLVKSTMFVVHKPSSVTVTQSYINETTSSAMQFYVNTTGHLSLGVTSVAAIGSSTGAAVVNTWFQGNATFDSSGGAYAFRLGRASSGSGSNAHTISGASRGIFADNGGGSPLTGSIAELIVYNRVLSGTEITNVENYLLAKWGV